MEERHTAAVAIGECKDGHECKIPRIMLVDDWVDAENKEQKENTSFA